ncbi:WD40-repeat-containing domain protein, partial [Pisolithus tinctorius]
MPLLYSQYQRLEGEHKDKITSLAFSTNGSYLAVASLNGKLSVWSTTTGKKLYAVESGPSNIAMLSIVWMTPSENQLLCGLANGVVISVHADNEVFTVTGFRAHSHLPIECLVVQGDLVVTSMPSEVSLWNHRGATHWVHLGHIHPPPSISANREADVIVTSLAWARTKYSAKTLLIAYLHHGILLWDATKSKMAHFLYIKTLVGSMSISRNGNVIVVSNLNDGFDIYHLDDSTLDGPVMQPCNGLRVPVTFIHNGYAFLGGSTSEQAHIWDTKDRTLLNTLQHDTGDTVLAIAAHFNHKDDQFLIGTGVYSLERQNPHVQLWRA